MTDKPTEPPVKYPLGPVPAEKRYQLRLSIALNRILESAKEEPLTLGMIINTTQERAFGVLMAFLCIPFLLPVSIPGTSIPFGLALMIVGVQLAVGKNRPWLPAKLRQWKLPQKFATRLIGLLAKFFRPLERIVRPRFLFMQNPASMVLIGITLVLDGFFLSLPWPPFIPLTNTIPAWVALVKIIGITEEDGIFLIAGISLTFIATLACILGFVLGGEAILSHAHSRPASQPTSMSASMPSSMPATTMPR